MRRILRFDLALLVIVVAVAWWLTQPITISADALPEHSPDPVAGERMFWVGGCASCHASPVDGKRAMGEAKLLLGGGVELETPYGVFRVPNISSHTDDGIGSWSMLDFVNAMQRGVSPEGRHYYPSFPYASYAKMPAEDVMDLRAYLATLPPVAGQTDGHSLGFPWSMRGGIGLWKRLYMDAEPVARVQSESAEIEQGRALVEGAGHCGECHTPRNLLGGMRSDRWLAGAPSLEGAGSTPNITPAGKNLASWSASDIAYYLESGFTPDFDTVGGSMVAVQENMAMLTAEDRSAIAAYLKAIPPVE